MRTQRTSNPCFIAPLNCPGTSIKDDILSRVPWSKNSWINISEKIDPAFIVKHDIVLARKIISSSSNCWQILILIGGGVWSIAHTFLYMDPALGEVLSCSVERMITVEHVPRFSAACLQKNGFISCEIMGPMHYSSDSTQGGLEIPCLPTFSGNFAVLWTCTRSKWAPEITCLSISSLWQLRTY